MLLADFWAWLESLPIAGRIGESWGFPLLESIHVVSATFLVGAIVMLDLRLLGLAARSHAVSRISREIVPWTLAAAFVSVAAGIGLFMTRAGHYAGNTAFQIKMALLVLAGINSVFFHFRTSRSIAAWDRAGVTVAPARLAGAASILLWIGIMLAGRWIGHLL